MLHRQRGFTIKQSACACHQQLQVIVQLGHRAHGGAGAAHRVGLVDGDGRRYAFNFIHRWLVHAVEELARIRTEGLHIAALALGIQRVEHQAGLARTARSGDHGEFAGANVEVDVLEVVLARAADANLSLGHTVLVSMAKADHSRQLLRSIFLRSECPFKILYKKTDLFRCLWLKAMKIQALQLMAFTHKKTRTS